MYSFGDPTVDNDTLVEWEEFISRTEANSVDALKALEKLREGYSLKQILKSYFNKKKEAQEGIEIAKKDFQDIYDGGGDVEIVTMEDCIDKMLYDLDHGKEKGTTTHIPILDNAWTWRMSEFNIWTGYANEGKSLFIRFIAAIKALQEGWPFAFYAPEDYPANEFFDDIIHTVSGFSTDRDNPNFIDKKVYTATYERLKHLIYFVNIRPPKNSLKNILKAFMPLMEEKGIRACVMDPLIKISRPKEYMMADDKYAGYTTTLCTDYARKFKTSLHLVMHQLTPKLQENGLYAKPSMYNIKGGGTWADGSDNILSINRPFYARDKVEDTVIFSSLKIKKQKLVGIPQEITLRFDRRTNRYIDHQTGNDLYNFSQARNMKPALLF